MGSGHRWWASALWLATTTTAAQAAPPPLDAYGNLPSVEDMSMSENGQAFAFGGLIEGKRQIMLLDLKNQTTRAVELGDMKFDGVYWAGNDFAIGGLRATQALGMDFNVNKIDLSGAMIIPVDGGKVEGVFAGTASISPAIWGFYGTRNIGGKWIGYYSGLALRRDTGRGTGYIFDHGRPTLYAVDLKENRPLKLAPPASEGHSRDWLVDAGGNVGATLDFRMETGDWELRNAHNKLIASGKDPLGDTGLLAFGKDGTSVIYSQEDKQLERDRLFEVPLEGGAATEILADVDIQRYYVDPASSRLMGYVPEASHAQAVMFDPARQAALNLVYRAFKADEVQVMEWTPSFSHFLVRTSGNRDSGTWYLVDMAKSKADPIAYERRLIDNADVGPITRIYYTASDGLKLEGILTVPPGREAKNLPVIVFPHGGPHSYDDVRFDWWAQAFASRGYAVFQPNFRGSTNRDIAFRKAGNGQWGRKMQSDMSDGLAELARRGVVDPKRACIMGGSYGGYAALAGVTLQQGLYRCAVAVAPVSDVKLMYATDVRESVNSSLTRRVQTESLGDPSGFEAISPRNFARRADAPILLIHGKDDTTVPFKQSAVMADALKSAGKPYEMVTLQSEDHYLSHAETRKQMLDSAMRFVLKYNPPD